MDVLVAGGGTAGAVAAIQAARDGATTSLVEMSGPLGGTMTNGGVDFPGYFHAWGELQVAGIGWELVRETKELSGEPLPPVRNQEARRPGNYIPVNMGIYAALAEEKALQAGVMLHYHEVVTGVERVSDSWQVHTVGKNTRRIIQAREIIDCTGDADIVGMLGLDREMAEIRQPGTMPTIPFGALIPKGSRHILVAGRALSSDRVAHAGMREQPFCMAMGQAAGAAAALAVRHGIASRDVDLMELRGLLKTHGAVVRCNQRKGTCYDRRITLRLSHPH
jgi:hypothetical protein